MLDRKNGAVGLLRGAALASLALLALPGAAAARNATLPAPLILGSPTSYTSRYEDTLLALARDYDTGFVAIREANPDLDPWLPGADKPINLPTQHITPAAPHRGIVINLAELRLYYYPPQGADPITYPIGIGDEGKATPVGQTRVVRKRANPTWTPTASEHAEEPDLPAVVPAGPDNPMGLFALYLGWSGYAIHGSNKPDSIGRRDSHGCVRLYPENIESLFGMVPVGTPVRVVNQPAKVAWSNGELYLEVHPLPADIDPIEQTGKPLSHKPIDADALVTKAAGAQIDRVDWDLVHRLEQERNGMVTQITRPGDATDTQTSQQDEPRVIE